jgi:hypothetical protein
MASTPAATLDPARRSARARGAPSVSPIRLPQHPNQHRSQRPILLAVDQQLGEGATLGVPPELADPVGLLEVGEHQDAEQLGARSGTEGVQAFPESALELIGTNGRKATPSDCRSA